MTSSSERRDISVKDDATFLRGVDTVVTAALRRASERHHLLDSKSRRQALAADVSEPGASVVSLLRFDQDSNAADRFRPRRPAPQPPAALVADAEGEGSDRAALLDGVLLARQRRTNTLGVLGVSYCAAAPWLTAPWGSLLNDEQLPRR